MSTGCQNSNYTIFTAAERKKNLWRGVKILLSKTGAPAGYTGRTRVADPYHFNADPDQALFQSDRNLRQLVYRPAGASAPFLASLPSTEGVHGTPRLYFEPLKFLNFGSNTDPDPVFPFNADPDPVLKNNSDPRGSRTATLGRIL
jgi:hypothetical protein